MIVLPFAGMDSPSFNIMELELTLTRLLGLIQQPLMYC